MALMDLFRPKRKHSDPNVRSAAVKTLIDQELLADVAKRDPDKNVRVAAVGELTDQATLADIAKSDSDGDLRLAAVGNLTGRALATEILEMQRAGEVTKLAALLFHDRDKTREAAARALSCIADRRALPQLLRALNDRTWIVRRWAAEGLGIVGDPSAVSALRAAKAARDAGDRRQAVARCAQSAIERLEAGSRDSTALGDVLMRRWSAESPGSAATAAANFLFSCMGPERYPMDSIASAVRQLAENCGAFGAEVLCYVSLEANSSTICDAAARGLRGHATPKVLKAYAEACHYTGANHAMVGSSWTLPVDAANALAQLGDRSGLAAIEALLADFSGRPAVSGGIVVTNDPLGLAASLQAADDVFLAACRALGALEGEEAIPRLERFRSEAGSRGNRSVAEGLTNIVAKLRELPVKNVN